ncbi:unnamed protein product, partial [Strongylus vulgaris]
CRELFEVEPFLKITPGLNFEVILTQRANHACDYIMEMPKEQWEAVDSLVSVGGDGLFNEVLSGALIRTQRDAGNHFDDRESSQWRIPHVRFGIVGAGSVNSIVRTIHGTIDHATATIHIVLGSECKVDVCAIYGDNHLLRVSANAVAYCWSGELLRDSERFRCFGPARYQWSGKL